MKRKLADYLNAMYAQDVLLATEEAKMHSRLLLEDQGITLMALLFADFLADQLDQGTLSMHHPSSTKSAVLA